MRKKRTGRCRLHALQPATCQFDFRRHLRVSPTTTGALGGCASLSDILIDYERATSLVGVLEFTRKVEIEGNEGRNGEWRIRGCLGINPSGL